MSNKTSSYSHIINPTVKEFLDEVVIIPTFSFETFFINYYFLSVKYNTYLWKINLMQYKVNTKMKWTGDEIDVYKQIYIPLMSRKFNCSWTMNSRHQSIYHSLSSLYKLY